MKILSSEITPYKTYLNRRKFIKIGEREEELASHIKKIIGSKGNVYLLDTEKMTCTCPGFTFRGNCKHVKEIS